MDEISGARIEMDRGAIDAASRGVDAMVDSLGDMKNIESVIKARFDEIDVPWDLAASNDASVVIGLVIGTLVRFKLTPDDIAAFFHGFDDREPGRFEAYFTEAPEGLSIRRMSSLFRLAGAGIFEIYVGLIERWYENNQLASGPPDEVWKAAWAAACAAAQVLVEVYARLLA